MFVIKKTKYCTRFHRPFLSVIGIFFMSFLLIGMCMPLQTEISREYQIKAVFLFNFCQFVEWPSTAFSSPEDPMVIGILGIDPFGNYLDETVMGERVNGHPLVVKRFQNPDQIEGCHILFVNLPERAEMEAILQFAEANNVLTVSDADNFVKKGGMMKFFTEDNRIRIRINVDAAKKAGLNISSKLLKVADLVNQRNN